MDEEEGPVIQFFGKQSVETSTCLVHTPCPALDDDRLEPPLGLLYLATVLARHGYRVRLLDLSSVPLDDLAEQIPDGFSVYGFSTYSVNYHLTRELAAGVKRRNSDALLVAGGPHASALPTQVAADGFDSVVRGEGEAALLEIIATCSKGESPGCLVEGVPVEPLDHLPFPNYDLVDMVSYRRRVDGHPSLSLLSSRGCPHRCSFCNSIVMGAGRPIRYRSPDNLVAEIRDLKRKWGIRHFRFQDDVFTLNRRRLTELAPRLAEERIVYRCFARVSNFSRQIAADLVASGCRHVSFGVESGSPAILGKHAMNKGQTPMQIAKALRYAHEAGLRARVFLIVGFPGETEQTIAQTLALMKDCPWDEFSVYPLLAYPGTPIHDEPERFGIVHRSTDYSRYLQVGRGRAAGFTIRTASFDEQRVRRWRDRVIAELLADGRTWAGDSPRFR